MYLPKVEIKDYNVMIDRTIFFDQSSNIKTHDNIWNIATVQENDSTSPNDSDKFK